MGRLHPEKQALQNIPKTTQKYGEALQQLIVPCKVLLVSYGDYFYKGAVSVGVKQKQSQCAGWRSVFYHNSVPRTWILPIEINDGGKRKSFINVSSSPYIFDNGKLISTSKLELSKKETRGLIFIVENIIKNFQLEEAKKLSPIIKGGIRKNFNPLTYNFIEDIVNNQGERIHNYNFDLELPALR